MQDNRLYSPFSGAFKPAWKQGVVAIGNFDGVHQGHQALLAHAKAIANQKNLPCIALTFSPHPRRFFQPQTAPFLLYSEQMRQKLLLAQGLDGIAVLPFDLALSQLSAADFIQKILHDALAAKHIVVGQNFVFGHGRQGHVETLMAHGFDVTALAPVSNDAELIYSSTAVRQAVQSADMKAAQALLGRAWSVTGTVIQGEQIGRTIGFPTANIAWPEDIIAPAHGVYAVTAQLANGTSVQGVASYGLRPTVTVTDTPLLEVCLFDFDGDLYGQDMTIEFLHFIRGQEKFADLDALKAAIAEDCTKARTFFLQKS